MELMYVIGQSFLNADLRKSTNVIRNAGDGIRKNYFKIAHELAMIDKEETYLDDDFESVIEYAEKVFSIKKSSAYALIKIGSEWLNDDATRTILTEKGQDFTFSQIGVMLPYSVDEVKPLCDDGTITPDMSVRKIKSILHDELSMETKSGKIKSILHDELSMETKSGKIKSILHDELSMETKSDKSDEMVEITETEDAESTDEQAFEKSIIFTADGMIKYCGEFPLWFCDKIWELFTELLSGKEPV